MERSRLKRMLTDEELIERMESFDQEQRALYLVIAEMVTSCFNDRTNHMVIHFVQKETDLKTFSLNCDFEETAFIASQASEGLMDVIKDMEKSRGAAH